MKLCNAMHAPSCVNMKLCACISLPPEEIVAYNNTYAAYEEDVDTGNVPNFTSLIALVYPAVTGFLAGTNR